MYVQLPNCSKLSPLFSLWLENFIQAFIVFWLNLPPTFSPPTLPIPLTSCPSQLHVIFLCLFLKPPGLLSGPSLWWGQDHPLEHRATCQGPNPWGKADCPACSSHQLSLAPLLTLGLLKSRPPPHVGIWLTWPKEWHKTLGFSGHDRVIVHMNSQTLDASLV